jgi:hypothetical protein
MIMTMLKFDDDIRDNKVVHVTATMDLDFLIAYHKLIRFCQRNRLHNGDCIVFAEKDGSILKIYPVSASDNEFTKTYFDITHTVFSSSSVAHSIIVMPFDTLLGIGSLTELDPTGMRQGLHLFKYDHENLMIMSKDGMVSLHDWQ